MMTEPYEIVDDYLESDILQPIQTSIKQLYDLFACGEEEGYEFNFLSTKQRFNDGKVKTIPNFLKLYLGKLLHEDCNFFFQNLLFLRHVEKGIDWHIDSQLKDRVEEAGTIKRVKVFQRSLDFPDMICVYYPFVPEGLEGGNFVLEVAGKEIVVEPKENRLIRFKGHLKHMITPFSTETYRVSMITEQVKCPEPLYDLFVKREFQYNGTFEPIELDYDPHYPYYPV